MTGKLKLQGDMGKAMKLEKLMGKMRPYSTMASNNNTIFGKEDANSEGLASGDGLKPVSKLWEPWTLFCTLLFALL